LRILNANLGSATQVTERNPTELHADLQQSGLKFVAQTWPTFLSVPHSSRIRQGCPSKSQSAQHFVCHRHCRCCRPQFAELLVALILIYIAAPLEHPPFRRAYPHTPYPIPHTPDLRNRISGRFLIHSVSLCKQGGQGDRIKGRTVSW